MLTMLLATGFFEEAIGKGVLGILAICWMLSWAAKKNPEVGDAAKKAATKKAIDVIGRWLK